MTETKQSKPLASSGPSQLNLVNSSRLQALRKPISATDELTKPSTGKTTVSNAHDAEEDARLRLLIDQRLAEILARLPPGKRHSLFKIRFGISLDDLKSLPPKQIAKTLKIKLTKR